MNAPTLPRNTSVTHTRRGKWDGCRPSTNDERRAEWAARVEAERKAQEDAERAAQEKREANKKHCARINNEVLADLIKAGATEEIAKRLVIAIASGKVAHTSIAY